MSAKILAFDPNRRVPPRHYTPIAMRGRLLTMPSPAPESASDSAPQEGLSWCVVLPSGANRRQG